MIMKIKNKNLMLVFVILFSILLIISGCSSSATPADGNTPSSNAPEEKTVILRLGHPASNPASAYQVSAEGFGKELEQATNGKIKLEIYPAGQLGSEKEMAQQIQLGSLEMMFCNAAPLANFVPELKLLDMPFLFRDLNHAYTCFDGEVGEILAEKAAGAGFKVLGIAEIGFKNVTNNKKDIKNATDLKGLKMRVQESPILIETYKCLGADPTPVPTPELYTSLQQGVVDGYEGSYEPYTDQKLYEVQGNLSEVNISYGACLLLINKQLFDSFDPETQKIIVGLGKKYTGVERQVNQELIAKYREICKQNGVKIIEPKDIDRDSFVKAVKSVYDNNQDVADLVAKINNVK